MGEENLGYLSQDWYYLDHSKMSKNELAKVNLDHPDAFIEHYTVHKSLL